MSGGKKDPNQTSAWQRITRHGGLAVLVVIPLALAVKAVRVAGLEASVLIAPFSALALLTGIAFAFWFHRSELRMRDLLEEEHFRRATLLRHIASLEALVDASRDIGAAGSGKALFGTLAHQSRRLAEADGVAIVMVSEKGARVVASEGPSADAACEFMLGIAQRPFGTDEALRASSVQEVTRVAGEVLAELCKHPGSVVAVPMIVAGHRVGWIGIVRTIESTSVEDFAVARSLTAVSCMASSLLAATRANRRLRRSNSRLQTSMSELARTQTSLVRGEKLRAIGELVSGVAHELTNPLAALSGYAQLLNMDPVVNDGPRRRWIEEIERETQRAAAVLRNLTMFARKPSGDDRPAPLAETVAATLALKAYDTRKVGVVIKNTVPPDLPMPAMGAQALQQVLLNLINNGITAVSGREVKELSISARQEGSNIVLAVSDTGCGIGSERLPHIFEPFFTTQKRGDAIGLGLTTARQVVTDAGGSIDVASTPDVGTTLSVSIPVIT